MSWFSPECKGNETIKIKYYMSSRLCLLLLLSLTLPKICIQVAEHVKGNATANLRAKSCVHAPCPQAKEQRFEIN